MKKFLISIRDLFTREIRLWKFYTIREFFDNGGHILTLIPGANDGSDRANYYRYTSYESFVEDWPNNQWRCGQYTEYMIFGVEATPENVPESGFVARVPKRVPRYDNVSLGIAAVGLIVSLITMFCISISAGFLSLGLAITMTGVFLFYMSTKQTVSIIDK